MDEHTMYLLELCEVPLAAMFGAASFIFLVKFVGEWKSVRRLREEMFLRRLTWTEVGECK